MVLHADGEYTRRVIDHERAVREGKAGGQEAPPERLGLVAHVDLDVLVNAVHVSPLAPAWVEDVLEAVVSRYGYDWPVERSTLADEPVY